MNSVQVSIMEDTYKEELKKQIKEDVEELGFNLKNISLEVNLETGEITNIELYVNKNNEKSNNDISINEIEIGETNNRENDLSKQEIDKIKSMVEENYSVDYEEITINSI